MTKAAATLLFFPPRGNFLLSGPLCGSLPNPHPLFSWPPALFALQILTFLRASIECLFAGLLLRLCLCLWDSAVKFPLMRVSLRVHTVPKNYSFGQNTWAILQQGYSVSCIKTSLQFVKVNAFFFISRGILLAVMLDNTLCLKNNNNNKIIKSTSYFL